MKQAWIPTKREVPGIALAMGLGLLSWAISIPLVQALPGLSGVVIAIALGAFIINTPVAKLLGLASPETRDADAFERGLRFTGKWILRLAIILMGLKIELGLFHPSQVGTLALVLLFTIPTTFLLIQAASHWLGLRRELGDLLSIGTMICGASAINALAPALVARRQEQGLAISVIFVFSIVALFGFAPVAAWLDIPPSLSGLWAGLAVNDLSSAIAVGSQFGTEPELLATAAKSSRIILLGPLLILFSIGRSTGTGVKTQGFWNHFPKFILGYFFLFAVRWIGDMTWGDAPQWESFLSLNSLLVKWIILGVCAGIGLQVEVKTLVQAGLKTLGAGGVGALSMMALTLGMLHEIHHERVLNAIAMGAGTLVVASAAYWGLTRGQRRDEMVLARVEAGGRVSIREAITVLDHYDSQGTIPRDLIVKLVGALSPVIGEIQPLRMTPLESPIAYRRLKYWESPSGQGSLFGIAWPPGSSAHIHTHGNDCWSKTVEGDLEVTHFTKVGESELQREKRERLEPGGSMEMLASNTLHALANPGMTEAIHVHFYGPSLTTEAVRYEPEENRHWSDFAEGDRFSVLQSKEILPSGTFEG